MSIVPLYRVTPIQCGDCLTNEQMRSDGTQVHLPEGWAALELTGPSRYLTLMFLCQRCGDKTTAMPEPPGNLLKVEHQVGYAYNAPGPRRTFLHLGKDAWSHMATYPSETECGVTGSE
jgi:hypothetical protein